MRARAHAILRLLLRTRHERAAYDLMAQRNSLPTQADAHAAASSFFSQRPPTSTADAVMATARGRVPSLGLRHSHQPPQQLPHLVLRGPGAWHPAAHLGTSTATVPSSPTLGLLRAMGFSRPGSLLLGVIGDAPVMLPRHVADTVAAAFRRAAARSPQRVALRNGPRLLHATGMGLAAAITREDREWSPTPASVLRLLASTKGPQRLGIGWLPKDIRDLSAVLLAHGAVAVALYYAWLFPAVIPWVVVASLLAYATRPDLISFRAFIHDRAPDMARRKTELLDRIRTRVAPYLMSVGTQPVVSDYGLFTIISVRDYADYVYVYFGFLSRWVLLGWYNAQDDFNFDRIGE